MSLSLHRAVSAYLDVVNVLCEVDRHYNTEFGPILDRLHIAAHHLLPLLEGVAPAELIELVRDIGDDFTPSGVGTVDFKRFWAEGARIVRELQRIQRECQPTAAPTEDTTSPSERVGTSRNNSPDFRTTPDSAPVRGSPPG